MNTQEPDKNTPPRHAQSDGFTIDYKRILYHALRHWYFIALSILGSLTIAFLVNRYAVRVYPITASLLVKEAEDVSGAELLYNNPLVNFRRNYLNEIYILKSYPLIQRVVEDFNFDVAFYRQGSILTAEVYDDLPVEAFAMREASVKPCRFIFTALSQHEYQLEPNGEEEDEQLVARKFAFGDTIAYGDFHGFVRIKSVEELKPFVGEPLIYQYTPSLIVADRYIRRLKAEWAEEGAGVINLSIESTNPKKEKNFLKGLIETYQNNDLENKNETASRTVDFISEQLTGISDSLRKVEHQLQRFKNENVVTDLNSEALRLYGKIEELETQKAQIAISRNYYKYLIDYINQNKNLHQIILPTSVGITDPILTDMVTQMTTIQMDIKMTNKTNNPLITEGIRKINEIKKDIIESIRNQASTDRIKSDFLNTQIRGIEKQLNHLPIAQRTLVSIQRNYTLLENLYIFLLQKRSEAAISKASNTSDILLVNPPKSGEAISPRPMRNYVLALMLGIFLPVFGLVAREFLDTRVQSKEDIEKITDIPFIGGLGHKSTDTNLAVFDQPKSLLAESFRALRSNLNYFVRKQDKSIFLITSSISGEGKTFTSINLAAVLSMSGKRTLIVGADLRKPKIYSDFNLSNDMGLSTYLAGMAGFKDIVQKTSKENLDFVSGGPVPPNPSELLLGARMQEFINEAQSYYDFVVIDTPPLAIVTDAFIMSPYADHILFMVRQNYTPKALLKMADEYYAAGKLKNISIVLNDIHRSGPGYGYGYNYGYGYGYSYGVYGKKRTKNNGYYEED